MLGKFFGKIMYVTILLVITGLIYKITIFEIIQNRLYNDYYEKNKLLNISYNLTERTFQTKQIHKITEGKELNMNIKKTMLKRKRTIEVQCNNTKDEKYFPNNVIRRLIVDIDDEITWCPICKAGSTVWMKVFASIGGEMDPKTKLPNKNIEVSKLARKAYPYLGKNRVTKALNKTTKFLIVRHPFQRLLSAYRDKLQDETKTYYIKKFSKYIVQWYGQQSTNRTMPTFEEFLQYIATEKSFDEHWRPYYKECAPCFVNYDFIIKMETFKEDHKYFLDYLGIDSIDHVMKINKWDNTNPFGRTDMNITRKYFSTIPKILLESIYTIYEKDFILFDYSPKEYFALTKQN